MKKRSASELKRLAREFLLGKYPAVMLAMLISFFLPLILMAPFSIDLTEKLNAAVIIYMIALVIIEILGQLLTVGVLRMHLLLAQKQQVVFGDLFWIFRNHPDRFILATILLYFMLVIPLILAGVVIYFFIPAKVMERSVFLAGVILAATVAELYLMYMFELIYPLYMEHPEMTVLEGFRTSGKLMQGNKKRLFLLQLSFIGWRILGVCSAGVGFLWIGPYMTQTTANFYLDLTGGLDKGGIHMDVSVDDMVS